MKSRAKKKEKLVQWHEQFTFKNNKYIINNNMKKVTLTVKERHTLFQILATWKGGMDEMPFISDDIKAINISDEEWKKYDRVVYIWVKDKDGIVSQIKLTDFNKETMTEVNDETHAGYFAWNDKKTESKDIEINSASVKYVKKLLDDKSAKGEITLKDTELVELLKKIS